MKIINWEFFCDSYKSSASTFLHKMVTYPIPFHDQPSSHPWESQEKLRACSLKNIPEHENVMEYTLEVTYLVFIALQYLIVRISMK